MKIMPLDMIMKQHFKEVPYFITLTLLNGSYISKLTSALSVGSVSYKTVTPGS